MVDELEHSGSEPEDFVDSEDDVEDEGDTDASGEVEEPKQRKRPMPGNDSEAGESKKKKLKKELFKPPTADEMTRLRETENLFHSNLFRLEIEEMMKEVQVKEKVEKRFQNWFSQLQVFLDQLKNSKEYPTSDLNWLERLNVTLPVKLDPSKFPGSFRFIKPTNLSVVGSFAAKCCLGPSVEIDVRAEIPKDVFLRSDYQNQRYILKRALYASYICSKLHGSELVDEVEFSLLEADPWKPILVVKNGEKLGKHVTVRLLFVPEAECFKLAQFAPEKVNIKTRWATGKDSEDGIDLPSSYYNRSVALDVALTENEQWRLETLQEQKSLAEGVMLLKVWLRQRGLDEGYGAFSGYIMSMYVAYLVKRKKLNSAMSSYQIIRNTWNHLSRADWTQKGCTLSLQANGPQVSDFHLFYDVVFIDVTGYVNICANMSSEIFQQVKRESALAIKYLDDHGINSFLALFMTKMPFYRQFDHVVSFDAASVRKAEQQLDIPPRFDASGPWFTHRGIVGVLRQALDTRVHLLCPRLEKVGTWSPVDAPPDPSEQPLVLGLLLDLEHALALLTKGPSANLPEAKVFRDFWGERSELRRFQDGTVCEAVVWAASGGIARRRLVCREIVSYAAQKHLGVDNLLYVADQLESVLQLGLGEDGALAVTKACDALGRELMHLEGLPLDISSVQGAAPALRYSDPFPPAPHKAFKSKGSFSTVAMKTSESKNKYISPIPVVLTLALSSKWPENLEAVRRIKAAFYIKISECLQQQLNIVSQPFPTHINVLKDGFIFTLKVYHAREVSLLKETTTPQGLIRYKDTEESLALEMQYVHLPKLTSALHGLHMSNSCLGPASCLAKRWVSSHLLLDDTLMPEVCVELLMAHLFLSPAPYQLPIQPQTAFIRFLQLLARAPWASEPIILNFREELTRQDIIEIENKFNSERNTLPPLFIVTPETRSGTVWTKHAPSSQVLYRLTQLANASLQTLDKDLVTNENFDSKLIFRTPMNIFDVVINLHNQLTRKDESLDAIHVDRPKAMADAANRIPVVGLDYVQCFLKELRESYSDYALFFCDQHGGCQIGVLFKPNVLKRQDFAVSHVNGHVPRPPKQMEFTKDLFIEDVKILGEGIVKSITVKE